VQQASLFFLAGRNACLPVRGIASIIQRNLTDYWKYRCHDGAWSTMLVDHTCTVLSSAMFLIAGSSCRLVSHRIFQA
jgi:hypothetical protein